MSNTPIDLSQAAQALYGDTSRVPQHRTTVRPAQQEAPQPVDQDRAIEALYGSKSTEGDEAPPDGRDKYFASVERSIVTAATERLGLSDSEAEAGAQEWTERWRTFGVESHEADVVTEIGVAAIANGVDESTEFQWAIDARQALKAEFGDQHQRALEGAKALIAKDHALRRFLDETGLGSHPKVVLLAARKAEAMRRKGRL